ncbi:hypothetical protein [Maioricimonas sp. JC845]|uniref:hypothetical protein n=1 Tax=Maioricimonas sp. JC845 TaxID=3232138 RepID=UPI003459B26C
MSLLRFQTCLLAFLVAGAAARMFGADEPDPSAGPAPAAIVHAVQVTVVESPETDGATVTGLTERTLVLPETVPANAAVWRGFVALPDAGPFADTRWEERQERRAKELRAALASAEPSHREELQACLEILDHARRTFRDPGQVVDAIVLREAEDWRLLIDADRDGRLDDDPEWTAFGNRADQPVFRGRLSGDESDVVVAVQFHEPPPPPTPVPARQIDSPGPDADRADRIAYLHALDGIDNRKLHLPRVIAAADAVIETFDEDVWRRSPDGLSPQQRTARQQLIDAVYRKGRALAYMELPDVVARHPIADQDEHDRRFEQNFLQLARLVDTTERKYFLLHIRRDRRQGNHGQAIRLLNRYLADTPDVWLFHKKRRDLYGLLGWSDWQAYEHAWMLIRFPEQHLK